MTPKPKSSFDEFLSAYGLKSLHDSAMTQVSAPSFADLVKLDASTPPLKPPNKSLFDSLLGSPEALYADSVEYPDKYNEEARLLLQRLVTGEKKVADLVPEERRLLDLATLDFATAPRQKAAPAPAKPRAARAAARPAEAPTDPIPGVDVPADVVQPYWWLK